MNQPGKTCGKHISYPAPRPRTHSTPPSKNKIESNSLRINLKSIKWYGDVCFWNMCVCVYTSKYILPSHENMIRSLCVTLHEHMWDSSMLLFLSIIESLMTHDKNTCYFSINKFMICVWMCFSLQGLHHSTYLVSSVSSFHVIWLFARLFFLGYIVKWNDSWYDRAIRNRTISYSFYGRWTNLIINLQQKYCMLWYLSYYFIYLNLFCFLICLDLAASC